MVAALAATLLISAPTRPLVEIGVLQGAGLPCARVHGIARSGSKWLVGGLQGLFLGQKGDWKRVSQQAVRQIVKLKGDCWVLYGGGSVDKVVLSSDRLYYDVFQDGVKRPFASSLAVEGSTLLCGSLGGWFERGPRRSMERYLKEMGRQPVTALARTPTTTWLGTQNGLFIVRRGKTTRLGLGAGLPDPWITALAPFGDSVLAGLSDGGLALCKASAVRMVSSPSKSVRSLLSWKGLLVLGALDGSWVRSGRNWFRLANSECTCLTAVGSELLVGTPTSVHRFSVAPKA
ncbi:MAG: hypothetical protein HYR64_06815 [Fimbriimonas ginsengisoli]|uniref:Uncharacterized protein n=1 Tax=Fimbriimonas ginsengisoli TaxID=1005039 RepID=A0A931LVW5_FIMGI|nr:hypothetical protein [Fimbriimonas ginsengisoli]